MHTLKSTQTPINLTTPAQLKATRTNREIRSDAVQNRRKILETAQQLFAEQGVENVTMTEIAEKASLGKGTLYRHYAYKGQLCFALLQETSSAFQNEVLSGFGEEGRNTTALGRVYLFIDHYLHFVEQNSELLNAAFESVNEQKDANIYIHPGYDAHRMMLMVLLKDAIASGECRADLDVDYMTDALLAALQSNLLVYQQRVLGFDLVRIKNGLKQLIEGVLAR